MVMWTCVVVSWDSYACIVAQVNVVRTTADSSGVRLNFEHWPVVNEILFIWLTLNLWSLQCFKLETKRKTYITSEVLFYTTFIDVAWPCYRPVVRWVDKLFRTAWSMNFFLLPSFVGECCDNFCALELDGQKYAASVRQKSILDWLYNTGFKAFTSIISHFSLLGVLPLKHKRNLKLSQTWI